MKEQPERYTRLDRKAVLYRCHWCHEFASIGCYSVDDKWCCDDCLTKFEEMNSKGQPHDFLPTNRPTYAAAKVNENKAAAHYHNGYLCRHPENCNCMTDEEMAEMWGYAGFETFGYGPKPWHNQASGSPTTTHYHGNQTTYKPTIKHDMQKEGRVGKGSFKDAFK